MAVVARTMVQRRFSPRGWILGLAACAALAHAAAAQSYAEIFLSGWAAAEQGELERAEHAFRRCESIAPESPVPVQHLARVAALAGDRERALAQLERAVELGFRDAAVAEADPALAPLRTELGFRELLERMRAAALPSREALVVEPWPYVPSAQSRCSPRKDRCVTGRGRAVHLVDLPSGETLALLIAKSGRIDRCLFDPAGARIATWGPGEPVCVWSAEDGEFIAELGALTASRGQAAFSSDGRHLVVFDEWTAPTAWEVASGRLLGALGTKGVACAAIELDGRRVTGTLRAFDRDRGLLWDVESAREVARVEAARGGLIRCGFAARGGLCWFSATDGGVRVLSSESGSEVQAQLAVEDPKTWIDNDPRLSAGPSELAVEAVAPAPSLIETDSSRGFSDQELPRARNPLLAEDPLRLVRLFPDGTVRVLDLRAGAQRTLTGTPTNSTRLLACAPSGAFVLASTPAGEVLALDLADGSERYRVSAFPPPPYPHFLAFDPSGESFLTFGRYVQASLWRASDGVLIAGLEGDPIFEAAWSADGKLLATRGTSEGVDLRDGLTGTPLRPPLENGAPLEALALHESGELLVTGDNDLRARVFDARSGELVAVLPYTDPPYFGTLGFVRLSPDRRFILTTTCSAWEVACTDVASGALAWKHGNGTGNEFAIDARFSADGARVYAAIGSWKDLAVLDARDGSVLLDLRTRESGALAVARDDSLLAHGENPLRVYDGRSLALRYERVDFSDGSALLVAANGCFSGDPAAFERAHLLSDHGSARLAAVAPLLLDPLRVRMAAAGVPLLPVELPQPPRVVSAEIEASADAAGCPELRAVATSERRIAGFEVELDGHAIGAEELQRATFLSAEGRRAELRLSLANGFGHARVRARARTGVLSAPRVVVP